jgi:hypothetical protein
VYDYRGLLWGSPVVYYEQPPRIAWYATMRSDQPLRDFLIETGLGDALSPPLPQESQAE